MKIRIETITSMVLSLIVLSIPTLAAYFLLFHQPPPALFMCEYCASTNNSEWCSQKELDNWCVHGIMTSTLDYGVNGYGHDYILGYRVI